MWYIFEYANDHNFVSSVVGEVLTCEEFSDSDQVGLIGRVLSLVSQKSEFKVVYEEDEVM